ncbi:MAG: hypothetical protein RR291_02770, partial [Clostridia bacterium]
FCACYFIYVIFFIHLLYFHSSGGFDVNTLHNAVNIIFMKYNIVLAIGRVCYLGGQIALFRV